MGSIHYRRGWMDEAARSYQTAANMDPQNREYRAAFQQVQRTGSPYRRQGGFGDGGMSFCDCCTAMICADCMCDCCCH
jgi:hypothetical protein